MFNTPSTLGALEIPLRMPKAHKLSKEQISMLIDKDIRSRLIAMVSKKLDMEMMKKAIPNEVHQERIRWTLNWS